MYYVIQERERLRAGRKAKSSKSLLQERERDRFERDGACVEQAMSSILGPQRFEVIVDREKFEKDLVRFAMLASFFYIAERLQMRVSRTARCR